MSHPIGDAALQRNPVLPAIDTAAHLARAREALDSAELDALVVTNPTNIRWLTGFTGSAGVVVLAPDDVTLVTDGRYATQAPQQLEAAQVPVDLIIEVRTAVAVAGAVGKASVVGLEADHITWGAQNDYANRLSGATLKPVHELLVGLRAVKDEGEVARMRHAAAIADATLAEVAAQMAEGPTELEIGLALDSGMRARGATAAAYETIVGSGPNGAMPHARPTDRVIQTGDMVVIDVGALYDGYRSDMTRSFVVGQPNDHQQRHFDVVQAAQAAGVNAAGPGVPTKDVDSAAREVITAAGWGAEFSHGTGHGVGLDIHELPRVGSASTDVLAPGMFLTVEPGVYLPGQAGVRWEDLLLVTETGVEPITHSPKAPAVL